MPPITLYYHAILREKTGAASETLELPAGATAAVVLSHFFAKYPTLRPLEKSLKIAINDTVAGPDVTVTTGDRVDLLPPFGGG